MFVVTGTTDEEWETARTGTKQQIAFYGSTPGYHGVLGCTAGRTSAPSSTSSRARASGWRWASSSPTRCSRRSRWSRRPTRWPPAILARYGDILDRLNFDAPYKSDPEVWTSVLRAAQGGRLTDVTTTAEAGSARPTRAFYAALEARDLDAMARGLGALRPHRRHASRAGRCCAGGPRVAGSWDAIFRNTGYIQFVLTDEQVTVVGDTAWVTLDENILQSAQRARRALGLEGDERRTCSCATRPTGAWWCTTRRR